MWSQSLAPDVSETPVILAGDSGRISGDSDLDTAYGHTFLQPIIPETPAGIAGDSGKTGDSGWITGDSG